MHAAAALSCSLAQLGVHGEARSQDFWTRLAQCMKTAYQARLIPADDWFDTLQPMCAVAPTRDGYQQASDPQAFCAPQVAISGRSGERSPQTQQAEHGAPGQRARGARQRGAPVSGQQSCADAVCSVATSMLPSL